jgi:hypothetical protein
MRTLLRVALGLSLGLPLALLTLAPASAQTPLTTLPSAGPQPPASPHMEIIHHPNYDKTVFMPFVPGIKINREDSLARRHHGAAGLSRPSAQA